MTASPPPRRGPDLVLTPRELEILACVAEGKTNKEIAARLGISEHTVRSYVSAILAKLGARSRTQALVRAGELRLL